MGRHDALTGGREVLSHPRLMSPASRACTKNYAATFSF